MEAAKVGTFQSLECYCIAHMAFDFLNKPLSNSLPRDFNVPIGQGYLQFFINFDVRVIMSNKPAFIPFNHPKGIGINCQREHVRGRDAVQGWQMAHTGQEIQADAWPNV